MSKLHGIALALLLLLPLDVGAMTVGGIDIPEQRDGLHLNGAGLLRKGFIFKIYVAALYVEAPNETEKILTNSPKRLDLYYFHHTAKRHMIRTAEDTLKQNLSAEQYDEMRPRMEKLHEAYRDGKPGSYASLTHRPREGLVYAFDGEPIAHIAGDDFANAYFKVWLGDPPSSQTIKDALLHTTDEHAK